MLSDRQLFVLVLKDRMGCKKCILWEVFEIDTVSYILSECKQLGHKRLLGGWIWRGLVLVWVCVL